MDKETMDTESRDQARTDKATAGEIACWFDFASNYSYLAVMRLRQLAAAGGVTVRWRPFLLGPIFQSFGWDNSPFVLQKEKGAYVWRDMERQCEKYALPWRRPSVFPLRSIRAARIALYGEEQDWIAPFCEQVMLANFARDEDIEAVEVLGPILAGLGLDAGAVMAAAQSEDNKLRLRERTAQARARGIFGAPTFFVHGEMFWGNDRLEDALLLAQGRPASG